MNRRLLTSLSLVAFLLTAGCSSIKRTAVNQVGNALSGGGEVFSSDDDPELIRAAAPFSLKLTESLLAETPRHRGLLLTASSGFTQYAYAFVQEDADEAEATDLARAAALRARARRLYLRARDYGLRGLEVQHADFRAALARDPQAAVAGCDVSDAPLLYWTAASWLAAISIVNDRPDLIAELPQAEALLDRAATLDDTYGHGAIPTLLIAYEMARPGQAKGALDRARRSFDRARTLGGGQEAGPLVNYAEAVCLPQQDREQFEKLLHEALAINPDNHPPTRLVNLILQRRARWLLSRLDDLFLAPAEPSAKP